MVQLGENIRRQRKLRKLTQEDLDEALGVSAQTISRWENGVNLPATAMIPLICRALDISSDQLLGIERSPSMAKLIKTCETFETATREEAEDLIRRFKTESFPTLTDYSIEQSDGAFVVTATKEFGADLDSMSFVDVF